MSEPSQSPRPRDSGALSRVRGWQGRVRPLARTPYLRDLGAPSFLASRGSGCDTSPRRASSPCSTGAPYCLHP
eukprot:2103734-Pleurochrysis_carterae.AAC.1